MANSGQNLIEFLILLTVVVVGLIFGLTMLGGNVNDLFKNSNHQVSKYTPFGGPVEAATSPTTKQIIVDGVTIDLNDDGSASFEINGQTINISYTELNSLNEVFNTVGGNGITEEVIAAYKILISSNADQYDDDVPIEMVFGKSSRQEYPCNDYAYTYLTTEDYNVAMFSVGDQQIMLQKDKDCKGPVTCDLVHTISFDGSSRAGLETESEYMTGYDLVDIDFNDKGSPTQAYLSRPGEFGSPGATFWFKWE